jgi:tRNA dimethylallyltransferase
MSPLNKLPKIIVIVGPTASGKSELAVKLAKKFNGEIISADSRQVYKGMDIGTGKVPLFRSPEGELIYKGVVHHLLDVASPKRTFTVMRFVKMAEKKVSEILRAGKIPIVCGGTGFYIQALVEGISIPRVRPNFSLRRKLEKKSTEFLFALLKKKDPERASSIDPRNKRRIIRALEIIKAIGKVPKLKSEPKYDALYIGIYKEPEILRRKILKRIKDRIKIGMIEEVKRLHEEEKISWKRLESFGLEYRYISFYLQGKLSYEEMLNKLGTAIFQYSKYQMRWFSKNKKIHWIKNYKEAEYLVKNFIIKTK